MPTGNVFSCIGAKANKGQKNVGSIRPQIVLFGDSITQFSFLVDQTGPGFGASLVELYARKADVVARGFAGYNSRWATAILDRVFPIPSSNPPILATVFFGANDAADPKAFHAFLSVPLEEYRENLHKIVAHLKKQSATMQIILITPPPVYVPKVLEMAPEEFGDTTGVPSRRNELTKLYADECVKVAQETGVRSLNLWSIFQETPGVNWGEKYLSDGIHFSAEGNAKVYQLLLKILEEPGRTPTLKADQMPWDFPWFTDLGDNPVATLQSWSSPVEAKV